MATQNLNLRPVGDVCGKLRFHDQQEAQRSMLALRARELAEGRLDAHTLHTYVCPVCQAWHVGHRT
jgi:hypothetical protein